MKNNKIILDLCGGTGAWSKPYKNAGYTVYNITLPDHDILKWPLSLVRLKVQPENIYGILAAPPCTMFSLARTTAKTPRDFTEGMRTVRACLDLIWWVRENSDNLKFWVLENPTGFLRQFLGKPAYKFQPYWFGDDSKKRTDLWGYFNEPANYQNAALPINYNSKTFQGRAKRLRSITPQRFAKAFFKANQ